MKRIIITGAALLAVAPASLGLMGNASFAQSVPVRVPSQATVVGGQSTHAEPGDDKSGPSTQVRSGSGTSGRMSTQTQATDDKVGTSGSGMVDDGGTVDVNGGTNDGAGHP